MVPDAEAQRAAANGGLRESETLVGPLSPSSDLQHQDRSCGVVYSVDNSVCTHPEAPDVVLPGKLEDTAWAGVLGEVVYGGRYPVIGLRRQVKKLTLSFPVDTDIIGHAVSPRGGA